MIWRRVALAAACGLFACPAAAQTSQGIVINLGASAATIDGSTRAAVSGSVGYRFSPVMTFGIEATVVPSLRPDAPGGISGIPISLPFVPPTITLDQPGGHAAVFTTNVRLDIPGHPRLLPYVIGGGGVGVVSEHFRQTITLPAAPGLPVLPGAPIAFPLTIITTERTVSDSSTGLALTIGGGISVLKREHYSIDVEGRYLGLFGDRTFNVGRVGAGLTYRF